MSLNNTTKYRIANKFDGINPIKDQFEFEDKGNVGVGRLNWSTQKKNKQGEVSFVNSSLKFICFGEAKDLIANNLGAKFNIEASLCNESFIGKDGKKISFWQLTVFKAEIAEDSFERTAKMVDKHNTSKANGYVDEIGDDEIPWL